MLSPTFKNYQASSPAQKQTIILFSNSSWKGLHLFSLIHYLFAIIQLIFFWSPTVFNFVSQVFTDISMLLM